jgi:hypothetical protein
VQSFSTFYGSRVENHAQLNVEFGPCRERRDAAGRRRDRPYVCRLAKRSAAVWQAESGHHEYAFAALLLIKHPIGLFGLGKLPAVGEQVFDRNFPVSDKARTFGLPDLRKGPRTDDRELFAHPDLPISLSP